MSDYLSTRLGRVGSCLWLYAMSAVVAPLAVFSGWWPVATLAGAVLLNAAILFQARRDLRVFPGAWDRLAPRLPVLAAGGVLAGTCTSPFSHIGGFPLVFWAALPLILLSLFGPLVYTVRVLPDPELCGRNGELLRRDTRTRQPA